RPVLRALPRQPAIAHQLRIRSAPPFPNQPGSRFQFGTRTPPDLAGFVERTCSLAELALPIRAEATESDFLYPVCDGAQQQLAAEVRRCLGFVEGAAPLTKLDALEL